MRRLAISIPLCTLCLAGLVTAQAAPVTGDGLKAGAEIDTAWVPWQSRLAWAPAGSSLAWGASPLTAGYSAAALVAGDRYLGWGRLGDGGGLRATGALLFGKSALSLASPMGGSQGEMPWRPAFGTTAGATGESDGGAMPYLGLGYSAWWARTGLGLSADLGIAAQKPGEMVRFGRVVSGGEGLDEVFRAMQLSPVLQVNLSYAF